MVRGPQFEKRYVRETGCEAVDWIHMDHDKCQGLANVSVIIIFSVL